MLSPGKLTPCESKVQAFTAIEEPTSIPELRSALWLLGYYGNFDPRAGTLMAPLTKLLSKESSLKPSMPQWGKEESESFQTLKANLTRHGLAVRHPDWTQEFIVHTDFSGKGIGAILAQIDPATGEEYVICCASRTLNKHERNYASIDGEILGVVWALRLFRLYLHGRKFRVVTDHKPIVWLQHNYELSAKHIR